MVMETPNAKRVAVWLTHEQIAALERISEKTLAPVSALIRKAVEEFLKKK